MMCPFCKNYIPYDVFQWPCIAWRCFCALLCLSSTPAQTVTPDCWFCGRLQVADSLAALALRRHTSDNVGVAVVDLKGAQHWAAAKSKSKGLFGGLFGG